VIGRCGVGCERWHVKAGLTPHQPKGVFSNVLLLHDLGLSEFLLAPVLGQFRGQK